MGGTEPCAGETEKAVERSSEMNTLLFFDSATAYAWSLVDNLINCFVVWESASPSQVFGIFEKQMLNETAELRCHLGLHKLNLTVQFTYSESEV